VYLLEGSTRLLSPSYLNKNRNHPDYLVLFPEGNIGFIHGPDRQEVIQVTAMVSYLKANPSHPMASRATDLDLKVTALDNALGPVVAAEDALRGAQAIEKDKRQTPGRERRLIFSFQLKWKGDVATSEIT
jgi:hypothetical protein